MTRSFEILGKFESESDCQKLLYAPLAEKLTCRETQVYRFEFEGDEAALEAFVQRVLVDAISRRPAMQALPPLRSVPLSLSLA